jgi:hypothetical protein
MQGPEGFLVVAAPSALGRAPRSVPTSTPGEWRTPLGGRGGSLLARRT